MKKITKKSPSKAFHHKRAVKDLAVKPGKSGTVRGGDKASTKTTKSSSPSVSEIVVTKLTDS